MALIKALWNRFIWWSRMGAFDRIFAVVLSAKQPKPQRIMIDALI